RRLPENRAQSTRRSFMISPVLLALKPLAAANPGLRFPTAPRDRLAIASYSLRTLIDSPRNRTRSAPPVLIDIKHFPAFGVKGLSGEKGEVLGQHLRSRDTAYLEEYRAAVKSAGARIVNIPTGVGASLYDPDSAKRATGVENSKKWIDAAVTLDCPSVRLHIQRA